MRDAADQARAVLTQDCQEFLVRVALMQEHRFAQLNCEVELPPEGRELRRTR